MPSDTARKMLCFSAPSGAGKTTLVHGLIERIPELCFSVSATSRPARGSEQDGVDYYFLTPEEFRLRIEHGELLEWEEVYPGSYYGTLHSEIERLRSLGKIPILDMDVYGALGLKQRFGPEVLTVFVMPPGLEALRHRLEQRGTDSPEKIQQRLAKAQEEINWSKNFDHVVLNDRLEEALEQAEEVVRRFMAE